VVVNDLQNYFSTLPPTWLVWKVRLTFPSSASREVHIPQSTVRLMVGKKLALKP